MKANEANLTINSDKATIPIPKIERKAISLRFSLEGQLTSNGGFNGATLFWKPF